jgi:UDP-N-acetylmuramate dehydrogenase
MVDLAADWKAGLRGAITANKPLDALTWLRVGGPADLLFQPADLADLVQFFASKPDDLSVFPMGVGSNLIVRDGGIRGCVIRLGRGFNAITIKGQRVIAGAAALDAHVARKAADAGLDLTFLRTIPGSIGGAVAMNAGCYGAYVVDHLEWVELVLPDARVVTLPRSAITFGYRHANLPQGAVVTRVCFAPRSDAPEALHEKMDQQIAARDASQPTKERTAGSTFRNPAGFSSTGAADDTHELKAWFLIDKAGLRGARHGGAQMSSKHPNFLINADQATAADLETLGEMVRKKVFQDSGLQLEWEVIRVGDPAKA